MPEITVLHISNASKNSRKPALDDELLTQARLGESDAFGRVYNDFFDPIFRFLYFRTSHQETAEDLAEEVFIKAFQGLPKYRGSAEQFTGWLFRIARNVLIDHYRSVRPTGAALDELDLVASTKASVVDVLNLEADQKLLLNALDELPPEQQAVLRMRFLEDASITEISGILDKSEGNVRIIQFRALKKLRTLLEDIL